MKYDKYKPKVLDWLASLVNHTFIHHFSDKWISVGIWNNELSISLDLRQLNQVELFNKLPNEIKGCLQEGTGKLVNEKTLYFKVSEIVPFEYPTIVSSRLTTTNKHQESEKGGWYIKGRYYNSYDWELILSDGSTIEYSNYKDTMDLKETDLIFKTKIEEKEFYKFIEDFKPSNYDI